MKHSDLITLIYKHRDLIDRAFNGELIENIPKELLKEIPIFQEVAKRYELNDSYIQFANTMLKRVDANYKQLTWREVQEALKDGAPANIADLQTLIMMHIKDLSISIRGANTDPYKQFWNVNSYGGLESPKPEEVCRDALVEMLRPCLLSIGLRVEPEGHMASDKRADICIFANKMKLVIELKRDYHSEVWTAVERQLDRFYTRDPEANGFGIYGVFWFGEKRKQNILDSNNWEDKRYQDVIKAMGETVVTPDASKMSKNYNQYIESWFKTAPATPRVQSKTLGTDAEGNIVAAGPGDPTVVQLTETVPQKIEGDKVVGDEAATAGLLEHIASSFDDGTEFISFAVDAANSFSDSFGNSFRSTDIEEKINSMSNSARNMKFNLAGGNVSDTVSAALGWATDMVKDAAAGFMDGMQISGLAVLGGAGLVDIPQHWDSSSTSIGKTSYTMKLIPVTNHPIARLLHQIIPLACVLAAVLPKSTGKQSYTSPFICEYYDKGRAQDRLAMFESVSVRRGITNTPYNLAGETLGIEVSFTIASMSKMLHMPISANFSMNPLKGVFDEETVFTDYMAVLSGLGMEDQVYNWRRITLNLARKSVAWDSYWNKARFGMFVRNLPVVNMLDVFYSGRR